MSLASLVQSATPNQSDPSQNTPIIKELSLLSVVDAKILIWLLIISGGFWISLLIYRQLMKEKYKKFMITSLL